MDIIFHLGFHKTGSSSIQKFLFSFKDSLLKNYKVLYPQYGIVGFAHHGIIWTLKDSKLSSYHGFVPNIEIYKEIISEITEKKSEKILFSSEFFSNLQIDEILRLKDLLIKNIPTDNLVVIVYVRNQDKTIESLYMQNVKTHETRTKKFFNEYIKQYWITSFMDYFNLISRWQRAFPEAKIIPRIYDRKGFLDGNVILDFLSIIGIDISEAKEYKVEANPSLSHLSTLVMRKINEKFDLTPEEHGKVIQYLFKLDREEGSPLKTFFTLPERLEFLEHFRESNERLFSEWFGTENKFVLSEEEIRYYEEQDKIPRAEIEKMVEDRYRKVLAYMMEESIRPNGKLLSYGLPKIKSILWRRLNL